METKPRPAAPRGLAMFAVLALIVVFTILGVGGILLASKDSGAAGTIIDIKSRESAAYAGLMTAIGRFQANTANTVTQLNAFISSPTATKAKWLDFSNATLPVIATSTDPGYSGVAAGTDGSAFRVEIVGIQQATPPTIILRSWGRGRDGDVQVAYGTYRIEGLGLLMNASPVFAPNHAFFLNGDFGNANMGTSINGNVFISQGLSLNSTANPFTINGGLRMGGSLAINAPILVTGNAFIAGGLGSNGSTATFQQNLVIGDGWGATRPGPTNVDFQGQLIVAGNLNVYGNTWRAPAATAANITVGTSGGTPEQLWFRDMVFNTNGNITVNGNAYFYGLQFGANNNTTLTVTDTLQFPQKHPTAAIDAASAATINFLGGTISVGGPLLSLTNAANRLLDIRGGGTAKSISGTSYVAGKLTTSANGSATFGQDLYIGDCYEESSTAPGVITATRDVYAKCSGQQRTFTSSSMNPMRAGRHIDMYGGVSGLYFGTGNAKWRVALTDATGRWTYRDNTQLTNEASRVQGSNGVGSYQGVNAPLPAVPGVPATPVAADWYYATHPRDMTEFINSPMPASDAIMTPGISPNQEITVQTTPDVNSNIVDWNSGLITNANCSSYPAITGACLNSLSSSPTIPRLNGYMILRFPSSIPSVTVNQDNVAFTGRGLFIVQTQIWVNGNWPASANQNAIQMIWVRTGGNLGNFGVRGGQTATAANPCNFFGYIRSDVPLGTNASNPANWAFAGGTGCTINGAIHFPSMAGNSFITPNNGQLNLAMNGNVFGDIASRLGILREPGGGAVITPQPPSGLQAWESLIRFRRISELR